MKRISLFFSVACVGAATIVSSCQKKDDDFSVKRALIDEWSVKSFSLDDGNQTLDQTEIDQQYSSPLGLGVVTFNADYSGVFTPSTVANIYFPTIFGVGAFQWQMNSTQQITVTNSDNVTQTAKLIFTDYNHMAILENLSYASYTQSMWVFYERNN